MITVSTSDTTQFIASGCAATTLAPNATCSVSVQFKPKHAGAQMATVSASATPGGTAPASVSGVGQNPAAFTFMATTFDFGSVQRTSASSTIVVTATNNGDVTSPTLTASWAGNDGSFAVTVDGCSGKMVAAGGSCSMTTQLTPKTSGPQSSTLQVQAGATVLGSRTMTGTGTPIWVQEGAGIVGYLKGVHGSDASHVSAVGVTDPGSGAIGLVLTRNATTGAWTSQTLDTATYTSQIWVSSGTNAWVSAPDHLWYQTGSGTWTYDSKPNTPVGNGGSATVEGVVSFGAADTWATVSDLSTSTIYHYTPASGWVTESSPAGAHTMWGTGDNDLFAFGSYTMGFSQYPVILHRDATGWTRQYLGPSSPTNAGLHSFITSVVGLGAPATTLYAAQYKGGPMQAGADGVWNPIAGYPAMADRCTGVWAASTTAVWFACTGGLYLFDGTNFGTPFAPAGMELTWVWGTSANNVYVVGDDGGGGSGHIAIYHLY
jgi:hypothetical protein